MNTEDQDSKKRVVLPNIIGWTILCLMALIISVLGYREQVKLDQKQVLLEQELKVEAQKKAGSWTVGKVPFLTELVGTKTVSFVKVFLWREQPGQPREELLFQFYDGSEGFTKAGSLSEKQTVTIKIKDSCTGCKTVKIFDSRFRLLNRLKS